MKIQRGKIAILLVVMCMVIPALAISGLNIRDRAMNACTATPTSEPNSSVTVEFTWSPLGWVCHKRWTDKGGRPFGETIDKELPLIP